MDIVWIYSIVSVLIVSAVSLIGIVLLLLKKSFFAKVQSLLVSFAVGTLLGGAVLHLLPESLEHDHSGTSAVFVMISIVVFFILEKYLNVHQHHSKDTPDIKSFGILNLIADSLHNFLDGILIAAAFSVDIHTGIVATVAILAHELPQEFGDFAVLIQAGFKPFKALMFNLLSALASVLGVVAVLIFPDIRSELSRFILPLAAGGFLYIALADLIPELNKNNSFKRSVLQLIFIISGILLMFLLLEHNAGHQH